MPWKSLDEHPVGTAKGLGLSFSLNTDDPGAFGCSMTGEYLSVGDAFGFTHSDFIEIFVRSLAARFRKKYIRRTIPGTALPRQDSPGMITG